MRALFIYKISGQQVNLSAVVLACHGELDTKGHENGIVQIEGNLSLRIDNTATDRNLRQCTTGKKKKCYDYP